MARDGNGNFSLPEAAFVTGEIIDEAAVNNNFNDIAVALTGSVAVNGEATITANLPMDGFIHTGVGNASARTHYAVVGQSQDGAYIWCGTAGGTANAITLTPSPAITAYAAGQRFRFIGAAFNTAATTIAVSGLTTKAVFVEGRACAGDEIWTGRIYEAFYDGTQFHATWLGAARDSTRKNLVVNPHFAIGQSATSGTVAGGAEGYILDQWYLIADAADDTVWSRQAMTAGTAGQPYEQPYYLRLACAGGQGTLLGIIEDVRTAAGKVVTLTIWARESTGAATITPSIVQSFGSGGSTAVTTAMDGARTLSSGFERYRQTVVVPSVSGKTIGTGSNLQVQLALVGEAKTIEIAYVQLEVGSSYTRIEPRTPGEELELCRRFYQKSYAEDTAPGTVSVVGANFSGMLTNAALMQGTIYLSPPMRSIPTVTLYSVSDGATGVVRNQTSAANVAATTGNDSNKSFVVISDGTTFTADNIANFQWVANARI